jgi:hypothetical protein
LFESELLEPFRQEKNLLLPAAPFPPGIKMQNPHGILHSRLSFPLPKPGIGAPQ